MPIAVAIQRSNYIEIRDEHNNQTGYIPFTPGPRNCLQGFTSATCSVRMGDNVYVFNDRGTPMFQIPVSN